MPSYTFQVGNKSLVCEVPNVDLPDDEAACDYAVAFASALFRSHYQICSGEWHLCSVHVLSDTNEDVFEATVGQAALIERDAIGLGRQNRINN
jgi:hypothetical protein